MVDKEEGIYIPNMPPLSGKWVGYWGAVGDYE